MPAGALAFIRPLDSVIAAVWRPGPFIDAFCQLSEPAPVPGSARYPRVVQLTALGAGARLVVTGRMVRC